MKDDILNELREASALLEKFLSNELAIEQVEKSATLMATALKSGKKLLSCGNGGSSCDAAHFAEELTGRYRGDRKPYAAIAITDAGHITCTANDYGFNQVFSRYIEALGQPGDVLLAISTSGNSENILQAVATAKKKGVKIVALTGKDGGNLGPLADIHVNVSYFGFSDRIQEIHIKIIHILILLIEKEMARLPEE